MTTEETNTLIELQAKNNVIAIDAQIIYNAITSNYALHQKVLNLYNRYNGYVEIKNRTFDDTTKINRKLPQDFRGEIIDIIKGYLFGVPITYQVDESKYDSPENPELLKAKEALKSFIDLNFIADADSDTGAMQATCGYGARLVYVDKAAKPRITNINPWEVIFIKHKTRDEITHALIYYPFDVVEGNSVMQKVRCELYDDNQVTFYLAELTQLKNANILPDYAQQNQLTAGNLMLDPYVDGPNPRPHYCGRVPVIQFPNNKGLVGDFERVEDNIDEYDRVMSDGANEIEEFRLAYMLFYGVEPTQQIIQAARRSGAFHVPDKDCDAKFLTKEINKDFFEFYTKQLKENILRFSKTVDMSDEKFSGSAQSGESRKFKLLPLENKAIDKERKFTKALKEMFECVCNIWAIKNTCGLKAQDINITFTRNLPVEVKTYADTAKILKDAGFPDRLIYSLMPFITDVDQILQMKEQESEDALNKAIERMKQQEIDSAAGNKPGDGNAQ